MADQGEASWPKVLILGHTLVCRLAKDLNEGFDKRAVENFDLTKTKVHMYGVEGRKIDDLSSHDLPIVKKICPEVIILDIGSYDLTTSPVNVVAVALDYLIRKLLQEASVQLVGVCLVIPCPSLQNVEPAFLAKTKALNQHIKTSWNATAPNVFCWSHRGMFQPSQPLYEEDGVYLNKVGQFSLYRSYRGAVLQALQVLKGLHPSTTSEVPVSPTAAEDPQPSRKRSTSALDETEPPSARSRRSESPTSLQNAAGDQSSNMTTTITSSSMDQIVQQVTNKVTQAVLATIQQALPTVTSIVPWGNGASSSQESKPKSGVQSGIPIGSCLPSEVKTKIWNDEYVDFGLLLMSHPNEASRLNISVNDDDPENPLLTLQPDYEAVPVVDIDSWTSAFHVFVGVYTQKHPLQAPALMKYAETVRNLGRNGWNWKYYDQNFRQLRQTDPEMFSWGDIHWELWMFAQTKPQDQQEKEAKSQSDDSKNSQEKPLFIAPGFCYKHHRGIGCKPIGNKPCPYKHTCPRCSGKHRLITCIVRRQEMMLNKPQ